MERFHVLLVIYSYLETSLGGGEGVGGLAQNLFETVLKCVCVGVCVCVCVWLSETLFGLKVVECEDQYLVDPEIISLHFFICLTLQIFVPSNSEANSIVKCWSFSSGLQCLPLRSRRTGIVDCVCVCVGVCVCVCLFVDVC